MGLVFLSAAIYRIFNMSAAITEMGTLKIPVQLIIPLILFELGCGVLLIMGWYTKIVIPSSMALLILANGIGIWRNAATILGTVGDLFVFDPTATDIALRSTFILILVFLFLSAKEESNDQA